MTSRRRVTGRLLFRIGLVCLVQLLLFLMGMDLVRRYALEEPWKKGLERNMAYNVAEWAPLRDRPEALRAALARVRQRLDMRVSLLSLDGTVLSTNTQRAFVPLSPTMLERLEKERVFTYSERKDRPERLVAVAIPDKGPLEAYAIIRETKPPPPPTHMMALITVMLVCTAITSLVFAQTLAIPLQRLAGAARAFGEGRLDTRVGMRRRDEFGQVSEAFDEMAERITLLLRSQKELLANVSHELRTPLARIRVALDLANEGDASLARESLADIAEDLGELERLVQDVLTAARLDLTTGQSPGATPPLRRERVEAQVLMDKAAARFRSARPEHRLDVTMDPGLPVLEVDPVLLRRAIDNLLDNAGKYSEPHTTVRLRARPSSAGLEVEVADEGIGIDAKDMEQLFTPFFRSDRSRARKTGGVGLGLALARRIVVAHGGSLSLESQPGQGTTARVTLPAAPQA
ncbi:sensor histidine kinase [Melittangium boletus]|uniref:histidine kinase n=1 Tax=Melittangium boletus DSM 14713 TaxID=1294270 RepID=A0A250I9K2_9BACT|nr:HAMP domain-containing sensor histidine kinase [Melittangium boletus]ATB28554.1 two-component sensor histidine kinase [Melittangium boletus DSM 14713]